MSVLPLRSYQPLDWTNEELSELYRVQHALQQAGIAVDVARGLTDEGDPWFVFLRPDGESVAAMWRCDREYFLSSPILSAPLTGRSFTHIAKAFVEHVPMPPRRGGVAILPTATLSLLVASLFVSMDLLSGSRAEASEQSGSAIQDPASPTLADRGRVLPAPLSVPSQPSIRVPGHEEGRLPQPMLQVASTHAWSANEAVALVAYLTFQFDSSFANATEISGRRLEDALHVPRFEVHLLSSSSVPGYISQTLTTLDNISRAQQPTSAPSQELPNNMPAAPVEALRTSQDQSPIASDDAPSQLVHAGSDRVAVPADMPTVPVPSDPIVVEAGSTERVSIDDELPARTIVLRGGARVDIDDTLLRQTRDIDLFVHSEGAIENVLDLEDVATASVELVVTGDQDLEIRETLSVYLNSSIDRSGFDADLSVAILFGTEPTIIRDLEIGTTDFQIRPGDSISLYELPTGTEIDIGASLRRISMVAEGASTDRNAELGISLTGNSASESVSIDSLRIFGANEVSIASHSHQEATSHAITRLEIADLQNVSISGDANLTIGNFAVDGANRLSVSIDAAGLAAHLDLDVSRIEAVGRLGRSISVSASEQGTALVDANVANRVTFVAGLGDDRFAIAAGDTNNTMVNLAADDSILVSGELVAAAQLNVDGLHLNSHSQRAVDESRTLIRAAELASTLTRLEYGTNEESSGLLFTYRGHDYLFVDRGEAAHFDASSDAILHLVGSTFSTGMF